jgi:hypothetical protein
MIYLAPGSSVQVKAVPKPKGVVTLLNQASWDSSDPSTAVATANTADPTGCTATVTALKDARVDAGADILWRYKNTNGEQVASTLFTIRVVPRAAINEQVTGADILAQPTTPSSFAPVVAASSQNLPGQPMKTAAPSKVGSADVVDRRNEPNRRDATKQQLSASSRVEGSGAK